jgi:hypothetical protein
MKYIEIIKTARFDAEHGISALPNSVLEISGFTSHKIKHLLNNICHRVDNLKYLEIGVLFGSTLISAAYGNMGEFYGIDNFCGFGGLENEKALKANIEKHKEDCNINFITGDCWEVKNQIPDGINVYFFDGEHTYGDQYKALTEYYDLLADRFIFIVDDWNWEAPRDATLQSIRDLNLDTKFYLGLETPNKENGRADSWWNGLGILILEKG